MCLRRERQSISHAVYAEISDVLYCTLQAPVQVILSSLRRFPLVSCVLSCQSVFTKWTHAHQ
jgi:hypothetical protein